MHSTLVFLVMVGAASAFNAGLPAQSLALRSAASSVSARRSTLAISMQDGQVKKSWFSRNVPEPTTRSRKYFEIEERGEFLAGPDRADEWGEELTDIGKWQRTKGPIYIQIAGGATLASGFLNYFALSNMYSASSALFSLGILTAMLGFALQRSTGA